MDIENNLIKEKSFKSPINSSIQKYSQEYKVLEVLKYLYPQKFSDLVKEESPDLQDKNHDIGIEVVSAVQERDMRASRAFSELCKGSSNVEKHKNQIISCGYSLEENPITISITGTSDGEKSTFQKALLNKEKKVSKYRKKSRKSG